MKRRLRILPAVLLALCTAGGAQAIELSTLLNGGSITAGDKLFDRWAVVGYAASDPARVFTPSNIQVTALSDGGLNPGPGLRFTATSGELTVQGDGNYAYVDLMFGFRASVLTPGLAIHDNSLGDFGAFVASSTDLMDGTNDNGAYIRETLGTEPGLEDLGVNQVEFSILDSVQTSSISSQVDFAPQNQVWVTKNVIVWAAESTDSAGIFAFSQRFSQTAVPEPASAALVLMALAGMIAARRRT